MTAARRHSPAIAVLLAVSLALVAPVLGGETFSEAQRLQSLLPPWSGYPPAVGQGGLIIHYDQFYSYFPWQTFMSDAVRAHRLPLWNPDEFMGTPFFANGQNGFLYPPRLLLAALVTPLRVHDGLIAIHVFIAGIAAYAMFVAFGLRRLAALLGGVAWMTNSFFITWLGLEAFGSTGALLPLLVLAAWRISVARSALAAVVLSLCTTASVLGGSILYWEIALLVALLFGLTGLAVARRRAPLSPGDLVVRALLLGGAFAVGLGMAAVQILPTLELVRATARVPLSYQGLVDGRVPARVLWSIVVPPSVDLHAGFLHSPYHVMLFAGTPTVLLALLAVGRRSALSGLGLALAAVGLLVMVGTPLAWLPYRLLPGFDNFRPLARLAFVFLFGLVILAACGADALLCRYGTTATWRGRSVLALIALAIAVIAVQDLRLAREVLPTQSAAPDAVVPATPLVRALEANRGEERILAVAPSLPASTTLIYGLPNVGGYESLPPVRQVEVLRVLGGEPLASVERTPIPTSYSTGFLVGSFRPDLLARLSITAVVVPPDGKQVAALESSGLFGPPTYSSSDGAILPVLQPAPRVELEAACRALPPGTDELADFVAAPTRPRAVSLVGDEEGRLGVRCAAGSSDAPRPAGTATIERRGAESLRIEVRATTPGLLVVRDAWFNGWHASIDGRDATVARGDDIFRVVRVPAGAHEVVLRYEPRSVRWGMVTSVASCLILAGFVGVRRGQAQPPAPTPVAHARAGSTTRGLIVAPDLRTRRGRRSPAGAVGAGAPSRPPCASDGWSPGARPDRGRPPSRPRGLRATATTRAGRGSRRSRRRGRRPPQADDGSGRRS